MDYVIGIDGGGTSTRCLLSDTEGRVLSWYDAPASNHHKGHLEDVRAALLAGVRTTLARAGLADAGTQRVAALCAGLAGVDTDADVRLFQGLLADLGVADRLLVLNDGEIALYGALEIEPGLLVISGTGSIVWANARDGRRLRVGGWDYLLSDEGSGYSLGLRALRAVAAAHDGRVPHTSLTESVMAALCVSSFAGLLEAVYGQAFTPQRIAALAPLVNEAAVAGDAIAARVVADSAAELVEVTTAVVRLAELESTRFPLVACGGVLRACGPFADVYCDLMRAAEPQVYFAEPRHTAAEGAVLLALGLLRRLDGAAARDTLLCGIKGTE